MSIFPVVLEHEEAMGVQNGKHVRASVLAATAAVLLARGADQIIIPVPDSDGKERAQKGIEALPKERRSFVRLVDQDAAIFVEFASILCRLRNRQVKIGLRVSFSVLRKHFYIK